MLFFVRDSLKEDALVDIPNTFTMPQLILVLSLFCLLVVWLSIFAWLALRPTAEKRLEEMEDTASLPVVNAPALRTLPINPLAPGIRTITQQTPIVTVSADATREMAFESTLH
jgi:hypothetical protein